MRVCKTALLGLTLLFSGFACAKDWSWELNSRMEMPGMPQVAGMGAQKHTVCVAEGKENELPPKQQKECKILDRSTSGKITRMTLQCKQGTMKLEHEQISAERWRSKIEASDTRAGNMIILTDAKRLAACDAGKGSGGK